MLSILSIILSSAFLASAPTMPAALSQEMSAPVLASNIEIARKYIRGPRGGCYYINRNGNKTYVDRSLCRQT